MTNACPGCSRPLDPGEEFCPSCRSEKDREVKEEVLRTLLSDVPVFVLRWIKKKRMKKEDNI